MNTPSHCSECGAQLPAEPELKGLCPKCLLALGLEPDEGTLKTIGAYEIERLIGRGGMGIVYKARQVSLNRAVALKILHPALSRDPAFVKRFEREAKAVARLNHQQIIQIYDIGEENGVHFFSMEYIKGRVLREIIDHEGFLKVDQAVDIISQVARALKYAHAKNIVHRDVKPSNIIVDRLGRVKIMDFGLAKLAGKTKLTKTATILGTVNYMSPEQARGEPIDHQTDIWSMGVVFYEMLAGTSPFKATNEAALIHKIIYEPVPDLKDLSPDVPAQLRAIIARAMTRDRDKRYQSVSDLMKDLQEFRTSRQKGKPKPSEKSIQYVDKLMAVMREKGVRRKILLSLALVAIILVGFLTYFNWPAPSEPGAAKISSSPQEPPKKLTAAPEKATEIIKESTDGITQVSAGESVTETAVEGKDSAHPRHAVLEAGYGTATIDGVLSPGEWNVAGSVGLAVNTFGGGTTDGMLYVMNDDINLYIAIMFNAVAQGNSVAIRFNNDNAGYEETGDDGLVINPDLGGSPLSDNFATTDSPCQPGTICRLLDIDYGGTNDGSGAFSNAGGFSVYELSRPLDSADDAHDFSLSQGDTVGFQVNIRMLQPDNQLADTRFPLTSFGSIVTASDEVGR